MARVRVRILPGNKVVSLELEGRVTGERILRELGLSRESYIVLVDGSPLPEDEEVEGEEVVLVRVISGG
ncbi:MAG: hypothetical protein F7C38_04850 [Desulfurococcales archaeon]|nr:hypothetical protein [Desulfurococcales archaeon]